jgi:hypothetical protein
MSDLYHRALLRLIEANTAESLAKLGASMTAASSAFGALIPYLKEDDDNAQGEPE